MNDPVYYLRRAHSRLHAAETLMANDESPEDVINRLYYAAREAALAILAHLDMDAESMPRTHGGLRALFHQEVVQTGLMDQTWNRELTKLQRHREQADYGHFGESDIGLNIQERHRSVVEFVEIVRELFVPESAPFESKLDRESPDVKLDI